MKGDTLEPCCGARKGHHTPRCDKSVQIPSKCPHCHAAVFVYPSGKIVPHYSNYPNEKCPANGKEAESEREPIPTGLPNPEVRRAAVKEAREWFEREVWAEGDGGERPGDEEMYPFIQGYYVAHAAAESRVAELERENKRLNELWYTDRLMCGQCGEQVIDADLVKVKAHTLKSLRERLERAGEAPIRWFEQRTLDNIEVQGDTEGNRLANTIRWVTDSIHRAVRAEIEDKS